MEYEAKITLKDGTTLKSYHPTRNRAADWIGRMSSWLESARHEGDAGPRQEGKVD